MFHHALLIFGSLMVNVAWGEPFSKRHWERWYRVEFDPLWLSFELQFISSKRVPPGISYGTLRDKNLVSAKRSLKNSKFGGHDGQCIFEVPKNAESYAFAAGDGLATVFAEVQFKKPGQHRSDCTIENQVLRLPEGSGCFIFMTKDSHIVGINAISWIDNGPSFTERFRSTALLHLVEELSGTIEHSLPSGLSIPQAKLMQSEIIQSRLIAASKKFKKYDDGIKMLAEYPPIKNERDWKEYVEKHTDFYYHGVDRACWELTRRAWNKDNKAVAFYAKDSLFKEMWLEPEREQLMLVVTEKGAEGVDYLITLDIVLDDWNICHCKGGGGGVAWLLPALFWSGCCGVCIISVIAIWKCRNAQNIQTTQLAMDVPLATTPQMVQVKDMHEGPYVQAEGAEGPPRWTPPLIKAD